jgi:hypothetical protein|nr:MAG TPA: protein of unknown function DUF2190 [Caudoviricetes sp.]
MAIRTKVSDGKSVKVVADKDYNDGDFAVVNGFHGFVIGNALNGDNMVINIEQAEYEFSEEGLTAQVGDLITYTSAGKFQVAAAAAEEVPADPAYLRVTEKSDANGVTWGILLPQG